MVRFKKLSRNKQFCHDTSKYIFNKFKVQHIQYQDRQIGISTVGSGHSQGLQHWHPLRALVSDLATPWLILASVPGKAEHGPCTWTLAPGKPGSPGSWLLTDTSLATVVAWRIM